MANLLPTIIAEKVHNKRALHFLVEAGGVIPFHGGLFALKLVPVSEDSNVLQLITEGVNNPIRYSAWKRDKKVVMKEKVVSKIGDFVKSEVYKHERKVEEI